VDFGLLSNGESRWEWELGLRTVVINAGRCLELDGRLVCQVGVEKLLAITY
jgi:hypothetical protein